VIKSTNFSVSKNKNKNENTSVNKVNKNNRNNDAKEKSANKGGMIPPNHAVKNSQPQALLDIISNNDSKTLNIATIPKYTDMHAKKHISSENNISSNKNLNNLSNLNNFNNLNNLNNSQVKLTPQLNLYKNNPLKVCMIMYNLYKL